MYKAVIFDFDGTLVDTLYDLANSVNIALAHFGFPSHPQDAYRYFVGSGAVALIKRALPEDARQDEELVKRVFNKYQEEYALHYLDNSRLYEGIDTLITNIKAKGIKIAVLSNKPHKFTTLMTEKLFPVGTFDMVLGVSEETPRKPDLTGAHRILSEFNVSEEETLYVGDSCVDMETAKKAGFTSVGVTWGFRPESELVESGACHIAHTASRIFEIIEE